MEAHERFEELSAAASIGEASGAELAELREHMAGCPACGATYSEFLQLSAVRTANGMSKQVVTGDEAIGYIDSALFRQEFLKRAESEGVVFSHPKEPAELHVAERPSLRSRWNLSFALPLAAACLLIGGLAGGYYWKVREVGRSARHDAMGALTSQPGTSVPNDAADTAQEGAVARVQEENRKLSSENALMKSALSAQTKHANELEENAAASEKERDVLAFELKQRQTRIDDLERQIAQSQVELAGAKTQLEAARAANEDTVASDQARIREVSDQLAEQTAALSRERDLLSADRDIRDLMAARNLHIADVFDTDTKGKTRTAFGRVFFTEGKSLIIYAYDLNDHRVQDAGYHYRVWGKKEGPGQSAKSLGIFYSDDKAQKRWVFKYDDPKVLSEIDSVFVTLEPPGKNSTEPKGDKFLYAYLRNQPNHP